MGAMVITRRQVAFAVMFISLVASYRLDLYFQSHLFFDGVALALAPAALFLCVLFRADRLGYVAVIGTLMIIALLSLLWGVVFGLHESADPLVAALTLRGWLYFLIAPMLFVIGRSGVPLRTSFSAFRWSVYLAMLVIAGLYLFRDPDALKNSGDPDLASLVRWDELRGYRFLVPHTIVISAVLLSLLSTYRRDGSILLHGATACLSLTILYLSYSRIVLLCLAVAAVVCLTVGLLRSIAVTRVVAGALVAYLVLCGVILRLSLDFAGRDLSAVSRQFSLKIASRSIDRFPVLGFGQAISSKISYEDVFGQGFVPTDLGTTGIVFRYGYVGLIVYVVVATAAFLGSWRFWRASRTTIGVPASTLPIVVTLITIASFSLPAVLTGDGIAIVSIAIGLGATAQRRPPLLLAPRRS